MARYRLWIGLLLVVLMVALTGCSGEPEQTPADLEEGANQQGQGAMVEMPSKITIGVSEAGSQWYVIGGAIGQVLKEKYPGMTVDLFQGGGDVNLQAVENKQIDLGISLSVSAADAITGQGRFEKPLTNVKGLLGLFPGHLQIVVRQDSDIDSISDLKGKTISTGLPGYATSGIFEDLIKYYGLTKEDVKWEFASAPDAAAMFKDRQIDLFAINQFPPTPVIQDIASQNKIRLLGISDEVIQELEEENPGYSKITVPADSYSGQTEDVGTLNATTILAIRADFPDEVAYEIVKTIMENREKLADTVATLSYINPENGPIGIGAPIHPGAEKFYKEAGVL